MVQVSLIGFIPLSWLDNVHNCVSNQFVIGSPASILFPLTYFSTIYYQGTWMFRRLNIINLHTLDGRIFGVKEFGTVLMHWKSKHKHFQPQIIKVSNTTIITLGRWLQAFPKFKVARKGTVIFISFILWAKCIKVMPISWKLSMRTQPTTLVTINPEQRIKAFSGTPIHHRFPGLMRYQCCHW